MLVTSDLKFWKFRRHRNSKLRIISQILTLRLEHHFLKFRSSNFNIQDLKWTSQGLCVDRRETEGSIFDGRHLWSASRLRHMIPKPIISIFIVYDRWIIKQFHKSILFTIIVFFKRFLLNWKLWPSNKLQQCCQFCWWEICFCVVNLIRTRIKLIWDEILIID
jgi:hypothetical protein